ncbi:Putative membrane spanning protein, partial (plasmid) [Borrelia nietonii YOR]
DPDSSAGNHPGGGGATDPVGGAAAGNSGSGAANQQDEALKQRIVNYLIGFITPGIKQTINTHTNTTWNEGKQDYIISGANQFFGVIQYTDAKKQKKLYNTQDDESKTARREMYLGFDYIDLNIEAFGKLASKMVAAQNVQMKTELANMVDKIREYARAFYLTTCNTIINKQDKLMKLDLNDLKTLRTNLQAIRSSHNNINSKFISSNRQGSP